MSQLFDEGTEVKKSEHVMVNGTYVFFGHLDSPEGSSLRDSLKQIRSENPKLYKALSLDKFD